MDAASVRNATVDDLPAIGSIDEAAYGSGNSYPALVIRQFFDVFSNLLFVVENQEEKLLGYGLGAITSKSDIGWVLSVAVKATHRKQGLGRTLCRHLVQELEKQGIRSTRLTVAPSNQAAISLYRLLGFQIVAEEKDYFGSGERRLLMEKAGY